MIFSGDPRLKHLSYQDYTQSVLPLLQAKGFDDIQMFAVIRHPLDWVRSWYTYRARDVLASPEHPNHRHYTGNLSFDDFAQRVVSDSPKSMASIRSQAHFVLDKDGNVGVDALFTMNNLAEKLPAFLSDRGVKNLGPLPTKNSSAKKAHADISDETLQKITTHFARDFELFETYA